jgi:hypothetical protein
MGIISKPLSGCSGANSGNFPMPSMAKASFPALSNIEVKSYLIV